MMFYYSVQFEMLSSTGDAKWPLSPQYFSLQMYDSVMRNDCFMLFQQWAAGWHSQVHTAQFSYLAQLKLYHGTHCQ